MAPYGIGLIARMRAGYGGVLLGYFFGPRLVEPPEIDRLRELAAADAVMVRLFGHRDIRQGRWSIIGGIPGWKREQWPMPTFMRKPSLGPALAVTRLDDDPIFIVSEVVVSEETEVAGSVPDGLLRSTLTAKLLGRAINEPWERVSGGE